MSPFRSKKQRQWMWANKPALARKWTNKYGSQPKGNTRKRTKRGGRRGR